MRKFFPYMLVPILLIVLSVPVFAQRTRLVITPAAIAMAGDCRLCRTDQIRRAELQIRNRTGRVLAPGFPDRIIIQPVSSGRTVR